MRILLIGFGNIGRRLARILSVERDRFRCLRADRLVVLGITTGSRGSLIAADGVNLETAVYEIDKHGCFLPDNPDLRPLNSLQAAEQLEYDVLVELSPLTIEQRGEPAISIVRTALERGRHVVTANKGPLAFAYDSLMQSARKNGCRLLHESTVMDGAPVFSLVRTGLKGCRVMALDGILNSTTNFVLSQMEAGQALESAVAIAQQRGFAEADPNHDLEGWDAATKLAVLANALMGAGITPFEVERQGILGLTATDIAAATARGERLKLVCRAWYEGEDLHACVKVDSLPAGHPLGTLNETDCLLRIHTDLMCPISIRQEAPSLSDSAYGVLNDLLTLM